MLGNNSAKWRQIAFEFFAHKYIKRRVRTAHGVCDVFVSGGSQLKVLDPRGVQVDPVHERFIRRWVKPDSVVWDVGANMGLFAFPAALKARSGQVYAFEPDVELASNLLRSLRQTRNAGLFITLIPTALSDNDGLAEFLISQHGTSMNKLAGEGQWYDDIYVIAEKRQVTVLTMDTVAKFLRLPDVMKIDVESAEIRVISGARATISRARPVVLIEVPTQNAQGVKAFFDAHDYCFIDGQDEEQTVINETRWDTIAVPKEKLTAFHRPP
jgi:FkbM family methyltransferase